MSSRRDQLRYALSLLAEDPFRGIGIRELFPEAESIDLGRQLIKRNWPRLAEAAGVSWLKTAVGGGRSGFHLVYRLPQRMEDVEVEAILARVYPPPYFTDDPGASRGNAYQPPGRSMMPQPKEAEEPEREEDPIARALDNVAAVLESMNDRLARLESAKPQPPPLSQSIRAAPELPPGLLGHLSTRLDEIATAQRNLADGQHKLVATVAEQPPIERQLTAERLLNQKLDSLVAKINSTATIVSTIETNQAAAAPKAAQRHEAIRQLLGGLKNQLGEGLGGTIAAAIVEALDRAKIKIELPSEIKEAIYNTEDGVVVGMRALAESGLVKGDEKKLSRIIAKRSTIGVRADVAELDLGGRLTAIPVPAGENGKSQ